MRKLIVSMMVSVDGFTEGSNKELDYFTDNDELMQYFDELTDAVDIFIFGRKSYDLLKEYWPTVQGPFADKMNTKPKLIFSRNLQQTEWNGKVVKDIPGIINDLKKQPGKDLVLFAGADLVAAFREANLIDEYRIMVYPVVLGGGSPFFQRVNEVLPLKHAATRTFKGGNVLLTYVPAK